MKQFLAFIIASSLAFAPIGSIAQTIGGAGGPAFGPNDVVSPNYETAKPMPLPKAVTSPSSNAERPGHMHTNVEVSKLPSGVSSTAHVGSGKQTPKQLVPKIHTNHPVHKAVHHSVKTKTTHHKVSHSKAAKPKANLTK